MASGLRFKKLDLHIHTMASHDFNGGNITPKEIVDEAIKKGLDGIAVTDHNTAAGIDAIKDAAKGSTVTVFPGVEVTCNGGKGGIHIIALFDPSQDAKYVESLLSALHIPPDYRGKPDCVVDKSVIDVINEIDKWGGLAVLAHANSSKGVLCDMQGQQRTNIVQYPKLLAAEATDFNKPEGNRTVDYLDGSDPTYKRKLAVYQSSDNPCSNGQSGHCVEAIGNRFSFFKLDLINLEGLRQCFVHPDARIRVSPENRNYNRIGSMSVGSKGFLHDQVFEFHEGLNCIIGGKGVGKSLAIEFTRFALGDFPLDQDLIQDHSRKLDKQLQVGNTIEIIYELANGARYKITRKFTGTTNHSPNFSIECVNCETNERYTGDIREMFPILAYSQTEVIKISENKDAQLELVDHFIDKRSFIQEIEKIKRQLKENDLELTKALDAKIKIDELDQQIHTLTEQISNIDKALTNELFDLMKQAEAKQAFIKGKINILQKLATDTTGLLNQINEINKGRVTIAPFSGAEQDKEVSQVIELTSNTLNYVEDSLQVIIDDLTRRDSLAKEILRGWSPEFDDIRNKYEKLIAEHGGDKQKQEEERKRLESNKSQQENEAQQYRALSDNLESINAKRQELLDQLERAYLNYYKVRKSKFDELTEKSEGKLRLLLEHATNRDKYSERLVDLLKGGSGALSTSQRKQIAEKISARRLIELILNRELDAISSEGELTTALATKVLEKLLSHDNFADVLAIQHDCYPQDVPHIQFCKAPDHYAELNELSVGQKCTALLIIALAEGNIPVIIDQPEDALDVVSVWEDVAKKLLGRKHSRQFILTTHNSSVAVAADSDQFIVMQADALEGKIVAKGAIDREDVKSAVISHLEGGREPYNLRRRKYNQDDPF